jgi:hypothetical protein
LAAVAAWAFACALGIGPSASLAQSPPCGQCQQDLDPTAPDTPDTPDTPATEPAPETPPSFDTNIAGSFGSSSGPEGAVPGMIGDFVTTASAPVFFHNAFGATVPGPFGASPYGVRSFKVAENESPIPRTRFYSSTSVFEQVSQDTTLTRQTFGFEWRLGGQASVGLKVPTWFVNPGTMLIGPAGTTPVGTFGLGTSPESHVGDMTVVLKYAAILDRDYDGYSRVFTLGLAVTPPTGSETIGDVEPGFVPQGLEHQGTIQPWLGFYRRLGDNGLFTQGFFALDVPFSDGDTTFMFTDIGLGRTIARPGAWVNSITPTFELHINNPLGNREFLFQPTPQIRLIDQGLANFTFVGGYAHQVNLTMGVHWGLGRGMLSTAIVVPTVGVKPFESELQVQYNLFVR